MSTARGALTNVDAIRYNLDSLAHKAAYVRDRHGPLDTLTAAGLLGYVTLAGPLRGSGRFPALVARPALGPGEDVPCRLFFKPAGRIYDRRRPTPIVHCRDPRKVSGCEAE